MSRITGTDAYDLMEAYQAVYTPQELTEEQVWEEVENWVNSLLEEGYDLSDYTWEEMYESYLNEADLPPLSPSVQNLVNIAAKAKKDKDMRSVQDFYGIKQPTRAPAARPAAAAPAARPAAAAPAAPKVSPSTPAKPTGPAMGKLGGTTFERRTPTSAELKAAQAARASGASPEKALQAAKSAGGALSQATAAASKPVAFSPTPVAAKTAPTPVTPKQTPRQARLNMEMEYDAFDSILEHLIAEGYADTEEAALKIMANMSEEWRQSIMEGPGGMMMSAASQGKGQLVQNKPTPKTSQPSGGAPGGMIRSMMSK